MEFDSIEDILQYQNILLDVGGTLVNIKEPFEIYTQRAIIYLFDVLDLPQETREDFLTQVYQYRLEVRAKTIQTEKEIPFESFIKKTLEFFNCQFSDEVITNSEKAYIQAETEITELYTDTVPFLKLLNNLNKKVLIVTNNFSSQHVHEIFNRFKLNQFHQGLYISVKMKYRKPNINFINQIIKSEKINRDDTILIGDRLEIDVLAAHQAGIHSCWVNRNFLIPSSTGSKIIPEYIINNLNVSMYS